MEYKDIIKYIARAENVRYENLIIKSRKREFVLVRQICNILGYDYLHLTDEQLNEPFGLDRCNFFHSKKAVYNLMDTDKSFRDKMARYSAYVKNMKEHDTKLKINCVSVENKMLNKRAILTKTESGWVILLKRLNGRKVDKKHIVLSDEAMAGIIESYKILTNN